MRKLITLAMLGAFAVGPAFAEDTGGQSAGDIQQDLNRADAAPTDMRTVRQVQQQLYVQGYDVGQVDGVWGDRTRDAVMEYQHDQNIPATGRLDQETLVALGIVDDDQQAEIPNSRIPSQSGQE